MQGANLSELAPALKMPKKYRSIRELYNRAQEREAAGGNHSDVKSEDLSDPAGATRKPKKMRSMLELYNRAREREAAAGIHYNED
jgi:hypothetical protein